MRTGSGLVRSSNDIFIFLLQRACVFLIQRQTGVIQVTSKLHNHLGFKPPQSRKSVQVGENNSEFKPVVCSSGVFLAGEPSRLMSAYDSHLHFILLIQVGG